MSNVTNSSSGHKLGQLVGDWFEEQVALVCICIIALDILNRKDQ